MAARHAPPCRRAAVAAADWPWLEEMGGWADTWANGTEPRVRRHEREVVGSGEADWGGLGEGRALAPPPLPEQRHHGDRGP